MTNALQRPILNFSAGPAMLPESVLRQIQSDIWDVGGSGFGILEQSHRDPYWDRRIEECDASVRAAGSVPDDFEVIFLQGGATLHFAMLPLNFVPPGSHADYLSTGVWARKTLHEAQAAHHAGIAGEARCAFDGTSCHYDHVPTDKECAFSREAKYLHYCSNNTVYGTLFADPPAAPAGVRVICDSGSEIFSRPIPWDRVDCVYACVQKNLGVAGTVLLIMRKSFLDTARRDLPSIMSYIEHAKAGSRLNTPATFGIHVTGLMCDWVVNEGGPTVLWKRALERSGAVYDAIDSSEGFYRGLSRSECRSHLNPVFHLPSEELRQAFLDDARARHMVGLSGHRETGGVRASMYNPFPVDGAHALADFMRTFARTHQGATV